MPASVRALSRAIVIVALATAVGAQSDPDASVRPLLLSAVRGDVAGVRAALDAGVPIDAYESLDERHWTALLASASWGKLDVVELLLARGADPTARDTSGASPLGEAAREQHEDVVARLLADPRTLDAIVADLDAGRALTVSRHAAWDAGFTASARVIEPLHAIVVRDSDPELSRTATASLVRLSQPGTVPVLADTFAHSSDPLVVRSAGQALAQLDPERARTEARHLLARSGHGARADAARALLQQLGDHEVIEIMDRSRPLAPLLLALGVLAALAIALAAALRDGAAVATRLLAVARDAALTGVSTALLVVLVGVVIPAGRALVGLSARPQLYAEGAPLFAALIVLATGVTAAWTGAVVSFTDLASGSRVARGVAKALLATLLAACLLPLVGGETAGTGAAILASLDPRVAGLAATVGLATLLQSAALAPRPRAPDGAARAWPLDRMGAAGFAGFALALVLVLTSGAWLASAVLTRATVARAARSD